MFLSLPFSVYFLSFLNYFVLCSLYVLLNFPIPKDLYKYLALLYNKITQNLLAMYDIEPLISPLSSERVNSDRGLFFGISTNIFSNNIGNFAFLMGNIAIILLLQYVSSFLRRNNTFRELIGQRRWEMIYGQVINIMSPLVLPWTFAILETGVRNVRTKLAVTCNILIFFMAFVFPIYYFFDLLAEK